MTQLVVPLHLVRALAVGSLTILLFALTACGDDGNGGSGGGDTGSDPVADDGCEDTDGHPKRAANEAMGLVVACFSVDESSLHVRNVSSQVLVVRPTAGVDEIHAAGFEQDAGTAAALNVSGRGWNFDRSHFILPLGGSLVACGTAPVSASVEPDVVLTAQANTARYVGQYLAARFQVRGRALAGTVQSCASTATDLAQPSAFVEDVLPGVSCKEMFQTQTSFQRARNSPLSSSARPGAS